MSSTCVVCAREMPQRDRLLCRPCRRSYDRAAARDATIFGVIQWAARRARRFAAHAR